MPEFSVADGTDEARSAEDQPAYQVASRLAATQLDVGSGLPDGGLCLGFPAFPRTISPCAIILPARNKAFSTACVAPFGGTLSPS
jgi:hypothetical protein